MDKIMRSNNELKIISEKKSKKFIKVFNKTKIPKKFLRECKSVKLLFENNKLD